MGISGNILFKEVADLRVSISIEAAGGNELSGETVAFSLADQITGLYWNDTSKAFDLAVEPTLIALSEVGTTGRYEFVMVGGATGSGPFYIFNVSETGPVFTRSPPIALIPAVTPLEPKIDTLGSNVAQLIVDVAQNNTDIAQNNVDILAIQNVTRFIASLPGLFTVLDIGDNIISIRFHLYNTDGNMADPDNNEISVQARAVNGSVYKTAFFDDEAGLTPATSSTTFIPSYLKMIRISKGVFSTYYKLPDTEVTDNWQFNFALEEGTIRLDIPRSTAVLPQNESGTILADNDANKNVIIKAIKNKDASGIAEVADSIQDDLKTSEMFANVVKINGQSQINGLSLDLIEKIQVARVLNRFKKGVPLVGDITFYEYDNQTTPFFVLHTTVDERTRLQDPT